ncbi:MAG: cytochrome P450 [Pseudomonadota bacterium]
MKDAPDDVSDGEWMSIQTVLKAHETSAESLARGVNLDQLDISDIRRFSEGSHIPLFARLRKEHPIHFCADSPFGPYWSITRAADIKAINADHRRFSSRHNVIIGDIPESFRFPAFMVSDPPDHGKWRRVVAPGFSKTALADLEEGCRRHIGSLLAGLPLGEPIDWVQDVSAKLTPWMIGALFDLDEQQVARLIDWSNLLVDFEAESPTNARFQSRENQLASFDAFLRHASQERRCNLNATDLLSLLSQGLHGEELLNEIHHFMGTVSLIVGAGETTRSAASAIVVAINRHPETWEQLREEPGFVPNAVQEVIRWQTPLAHMRRTAREDIEFHGAHIRRGDRVVLWYCSGNRDETLFQNGDEFDIRRVNARRHLAYGHGIHRCIGRHAAEMQLRVLLTEMLQRFQRVSLSEAPQRTASNYFAGYEKAHVVVA